MSDDYARLRADDERAGEDENDQLIKQTEGLDEGETSAIAGPDWDQDLVDEAAQSMPGEELEGEIER